jgi:hypothetical protein
MNIGVLSQENTISQTKFQSDFAPGGPKNNTKSATPKLMAGSFKISTFGTVVSKWCDTQPVQHTYRRASAIAIPHS